MSSLMFSLDILLHNDLMLSFLSVDLAMPPETPSMLHILPMLILLSLSLSTRSFVVGSIEL